MEICRLAEPVPREAEIPFQPFRFVRRSVAYLPTPSKLPDASLVDVFQRRRSSRQFGELPLPSLAKLLWIVMRASVDHPTAPQPAWEHRPAPSAGGRHPIHILAFLPPTGNVHLYDPTAHALLELDCKNAKLAPEFLATVDSVVPLGLGTLLWFVADYPKTLSRYRCGESLIWRDAGVLLASFSYAAEAMNIGCCAVGLTGDSWVTSTFGTQALGGVGGLIVGT